MSSGRTIWWYGGMVVASTLRSAARTRAGRTPMGVSPPYGGTSAGWSRIFLERDVDLGARRRRGPSAWSARGVLDPNVVRCVSLNSWKKTLELPWNLKKPGALCAQARPIPTGFP